MTAQKQQLPRIRQRVIAWSPELKKDVPCTVVKHSSASKFWAEYHNGSHVETLKGLTKWEPVVELTGINAQIQEEVLSAEQEFSTAGEQEVVSPSDELEICGNPTKIEEETVSDTVSDTIEDVEICGNPTKIEEWLDWVDPAMIVCDTGTQSRSLEFHAPTVADYSDRMSEGDWDFKREPLPQLIYDGKNYYPITGHHRTLAAQIARLHIYARIKDGTLEDAIYEAIRDNSNAGHGLPESPRDRRHRINAFFEMFDTWTDDKKLEELQKIDCFPSGKNKQKFDSWSSRAIACYLRIPASYTQVHDIQAEREQEKKYDLILETLEVGKWYQWHNGEQVCVGKLISKSDTSFGFEHPSDTIFEWQESISSFLNSVKEISRPDNIDQDEEDETDDESEDEEDETDDESEDEGTNEETEHEDEENKTEDDGKKKRQVTEQDRQKINYSIRVKCYQMGSLEETYSESHIAGLCEVLGDWAKINGYDGFAKGILTFAEKLSQSSS